MLGRLGIDGKLGNVLLRAGAGSALLKLGNIVAQFLLTVILARVLGAEGLGTYAYAIALLTMLSIPAQMGIPTLVIRMTAAYTVDQRMDLLKGIWRRATQGVLGVSLAVALAVAGYVVLFPEVGTPVLQTTLLIGVLLIPLRALAELRGAALRGLHHVVLGQLPDLFVRPYLLIVLVAGIALLADPQWVSASGAMLAHVIAALVSFVIGAVMLLRLMPGGIRAQAPAYDTRVWLSSVLPLSMLAGTKIILGNTDIIMIGAMIGESETALFRVAEQASQIAMLSVQTVAMAVGPHIASLYRKHELATLQRVIRLAAWAILVFCVLVAIVLIAFGEFLLAFLFGDEFGAAYPVLVILCIGITLKCFAGPATVLLNMSGHEKDTLRGVAVAAVANVILNAVLIPRYGILGAAVASALSFLIWTIMLVTLARARTGIHTTVIGRSSVDNGSS